MATINLSGEYFYRNGSGGASSVVGVESGYNRVVRYTMVTPAEGASSISISLPGSWLGAGSIPSLRFYIGTSASSHANAGESSEYMGSLSYTQNSSTYRYTYTGSANIILLPSTTYYVWVFPATTTYGYMNWDGSYTKSVTTSGGAASTFTVGDGTLAMAQTISVTRYSSSLTHTITWSCGSASGTVCSKSSETSISFTPPISLAQQNVSGTSVSVTFTLQTYYGDTAIGSAVKKTVSMAIPASVAPTCSVAVSDANGYVAAFGGYVQGRSQMYVAIYASGSQGSGIAAYAATANGANYNSDTFTTGVISGSGQQTVSATVTDTRGRTASASASITVLPYSNPACTALSVRRCNADGTANDQGAYVQATFSWNISSLNSKNSAYVALRYKKTTESGYTQIGIEGGVYSYSNYSYVFAADTGSSYDVQVHVADYFTSTTKNTSASTAAVIMHFKANGKGMGFGKIAEGDGVEFGWQVTFFQGVKAVEVCIDSFDEIDPVLNEAMANCEDYGIAFLGLNVNGSIWHGILYKATDSYASVEIHGYAGRKRKVLLNGVWGALSDI